MKQFSDLSPSAERIVDAAEGLIQTLGYNGFSYEDVAKIVGIRKPSIHHHFPSKMELGAVVAQRYTHRFRESLLRIEGTVSKAPARLRAYADLFEATYEKSRRLCICGMLGAEADSLPEDIMVQVKRFFSVNLEWLQMVMAEGLADGSLKSERAAAELAEAFLCTLEGALVVGRGLPQARGPRRSADVLLAALSA
ncbi:MAG: TetR/AcrR family transcriptional regulator [Ideonella sp.]|nr:TetR/AcrR family transcriptional regulator [Ideonella sp.]